ncbi:SpoIIE family protein phosphatase [Nonomuraea rosea]|uniref:SpoIIE family protein phosphatase n=1 Tax=Nonomuraea rosea TaxID=638574 RepID=A0ABP6WCY2_9ACTN
MQAVFASTGAGVYLTGLDGRITAVNPQAALLLGRSAASLRGADAHEVLHRRLDGTLPPRSSCELSRAVQEERTLRSESAMFLRGDGALLPVEWLASPIRGEGGLLGVAVVFAGIADRLDAAGRQAEQLARLQAQTGQLRLISEITTVLAQTLDVEEAMRRLGRLLVPRLADWAAVDLCLGPRELRRVTVECRDRRFMDPSWCSPLPALPVSSRAPVVRVLRGHEGAVLLGPEEIATAPDTPLAAAHSALFAVLGGRSAIVAPLRSARRVVGALTVARTGPSPFTDADVRLIADIARSAGLAADNASLYGRQRDIVVTMQRHLLTPLPQVDRLQLAARYLAAPVGSQVGGDWYDAFVLPDGVTALVIGDVAGHDLEAAGQMAQLRNMLRALAWDHREPPSAVVDRLNQVMAAVSDAPTASAVLAKIEPDGHDGWLLRWTSAGHLPPLLVTPDGQSGYLEEGQSLLLGVPLGDGVRRHDATRPLPPDSTLLLYTDGLVESPASDLDTGLCRLRRHAAALARHPVQDFCDQILTRAPTPRTDDIALLALRLPAR